jgi:hypothetical protein
MAVSQSHKKRCPACNFAGPRTQIASGFHHKSWTLSRTPIECPMNGRTTNAIQAVFRIFLREHTMMFRRRLFLPLRGLGIKFEVAVFRICLFFLIFGFFGRQP